MQEPDRELQLALHSSIEILVQGHRDRPRMFGMLAKVVSSGIWAVISLVTMYPIRLQLGRIAADFASTVVNVEDNQIRYTYWDTKCCIVIFGREIVLNYETHVRFLMFSAVSNCNAIPSLIRNRFSYAELV
jgi:hypothetical protein